MKKYCIITNDVETTSLWNHCLSDKTGEIVYREGMPLLLDLFQKYDVKATFYFNCDIVRRHPEVVKMILPFGHEVASHGWIHEPDQAFDVLSFAEQVDHLRRSKELLEHVSGTKVVSFRAPALRVNGHTPAALIETGFLTDSSIAPQRIDMFFSFGSKQKLQWLAAPRTPYFTSSKNLARQGKGPIFEIPVNSFLLPYAGTIMRLSPNLTGIIRSFLDFEAGLFGRPLVFLFHPNELIDEEIEMRKLNRRAKSYFSYLMGDKLRYHLKLRNLGSKSLPLLENQLKYLHDKGYQFITSRAYYELATVNDQDL